MASIPPLPRRRGAAPVETRLLASADEVASWARQALAGEVLVYAEGPWVPDGPLKDQVKALHDDGTLMAHQRRGAAGKLEHFVKRRADRPRAAPATARSAGVGDPAESKVLNALIAAAAAGARCPSDRALAAAAGLATRDQANWRIRKLESAGMIQVENVAGPDGNWRVVTVGGRSTLRPPEPRR